MSDAAWLNPRPRLTIEYVSGHTPFACHHVSTWRITSSPLRLTSEQIAALDKAGQLGSGQSYRIVSQCDGKEAPASLDSVSCKEIDRFGKVTRDPAINEYTGEPYPNHDINVFAYDIERTCDSGD